MISPTYLLHNIFAGHGLEKDRQLLICVIGRTREQIAMWKMWYCKCVILCVLVSCYSMVAGKKVPPDLRVKNLVLSTVTREVDLRSPLVKQKVTMVVENKGSAPVNSMFYTVEPQLAAKVAYIGAQVSSYV